MKPVIQKCSPILPPVDIRTVFRYARGVPDEMTEALLREIIREAEPMLDPRVCYLECPVTIAGDRIDFGVCGAKSHDLAAHLDGYQNAVLFAATIGAKADLTISRYARFSPAKELFRLFEARGRNHHANLVHRGALEKGFDRPLEHRPVPELHPHFIRAGSFAFSRGGNNRYSLHFLSALGLNL